MKTATYLIRPMTELAFRWASRNISLEHWGWFGMSFTAYGNRNYANLVERMQSGGLRNGRDYQVIYARA